VTVAHTLATSYVSQNALQAGSAAAGASARKMTKYRMLSATHVFLVAVDTLGRLSDKAHSLIAEIGRTTVLCTADLWEAMFPYQRISVEIQHQCSVPCQHVQFPSPHRNHSGHTFLHLLILRPWESSTMAKK